MEGRVGMRVMHYDMHVFASMAWVEQLDFESIDQ